MVVKNCKDIPEMDRIAIREAAISIGDIANNLLSRYKPAEKDSSALIEEKKEVLLSSTLLQLLTEKKYQYAKLPIKFYHEFGEESQLAFIKVELSPFKRMISNLINNAVDAFEKKKARSL